MFQFVDRKISNPWNRHKGPRAGTARKVDAWSSKHIALTIHGDNMLTSILKFSMSNDGLEVWALGLRTGQVEPMTMTDYQMDCQGCKKQPRFLKPHKTTYRSNIVVWLIKITQLGNLIMIVITLATHGCTYFHLLLSTLRNPCIFLLCTFWTNCYHTYAPLCTSLSGVQPLFDWTSQVKFDKDSHRL